MVQKYFFIDNQTLNDFLSKNSIDISSIGTNSTIIRIKLWCNCGTIPQFHPTVEFPLIQVDPTHLSESNG